MNLAFYIAGSVAVISTLLVITRRNAVHALLYLVVSFLAVAVVFYVLGAAFAAALEVIIYAGAVMVLFLFAVMLLDLGRARRGEEHEWVRLRSWIGPSILVVLLLAEVVWLFVSGSHVAGGALAPGVVPSGAAGTAAGAAGAGRIMVDPKVVGTALFGRYMLGAELASMLLLAGLVGAHRLTQADPGPRPRGHA